MRHLHDTRAPFWTGIGTGSRARQVQDQWRIASSLSFLATEEGSSLEFAFISGRKRDTIPVSFFCCANFHAVDQDKTAERAETPNVSFFFTSGIRLEVRHGKIKLRIWSWVSSLVCKAINRRRRRSVKGHSFLCKTSCTSSLMRAILWEQIKSACGLQQLSVYATVSS